MYKELSFGYLVFGKIPNYLPLSGSDRKSIFECKKGLFPM